MKKMLFVFASVILSLSLSAYSQETQKDNSEKTTIKTKTNGAVAAFDKTVCDLGDLVQNSPGTAAFVLTNDGNEPLLIASATASCGCTNLSYSKDPVLPGKSVTISATYNAAAVGSFTKTITVKTNASEQPVILQIKGKVTAKS